MRPGYNPKNNKLSTDGSVLVDRGFIAHYNIPLAKAFGSKTQGVSPQFTDIGQQLEISDGLYELPVPRNVTATAGGTATDIGAIQVIIEGISFADEVITETLPAFTANTAGTVQGNKAFKQVTKVTIPAHDGTGAHTSIGWGNKIGLPYKLPHNTVLAAFLNNVREAAAPTVTFDPVNIENNTVLLGSALADGQPVDVYLMV